MGGYCEQHAKARPRPPDNRPSPSRRGYDIKWRRVRAAFLRKHPACADCGGEATEVHHIVPLSAGGTHRWENLMPLCKVCHSRRTRRAP